MSDRARALDQGYKPEVGREWGDPFVAAFRASRVAMLITDPREADNPIVAVNDAFMALTGYSGSEALGRHCRFLHGPGTDPAAVDRLQEAIDTGTGAEIEMLHYRKDGTPFGASLSISPVRNEAGDLVYFVASYAESHERNGTSILSAAPGEEQTAHRPEDLQAALHQKTTLLHEVDHRLKNNLQVISSLILLNARRMKDEGAQRVLHNLAERVGALSIAHRLLYSVDDVSRFDLAEFLADLVGELTIPAPPGKVEVDLRIEPVAVSAAKAAPLALLANELIGNVFKHAFPGDRQGRLTVSVTKLGQDLRIVVEDNGVGLGGPAPSDHGFGKILIDLLVRQLKAGLDWEDARPGTRAVIVMPLDAVEAQF